MSAKRPPLVASWLLERLCSDPSLTGDLVEEYGARRSALWYWRQAIVAVSVYPFSQILEHKWLAVRAIATGYVIWYVFNATLLRGVVRPWIGMDSMWDKATYFLIGYALWMANGWVIAKLHRPYSTAMVLAYVLWSIAASVPPVYAAAVNTLDGSGGGPSLTFEVTTRLVVLLSLIAGGGLCTYGDQRKQARTAPHDWPRESPRALAG